MRSVALAVFGVISLIVMTWVGGEGPPRGTPLTDESLAVIRGANPDSTGINTSYACELASGYQPPTGCNSVNLGATCILCGGFSSPAYVRQGGGTIRLTNPTERTCNALGYIGTCAYGPTGLYYCDAPESPNGQCSASYMAYAQQPE